MVARLRHMALVVTDPEKTATFFEEAFGMKRAGLLGNNRGVYVSDGTINVALLRVLNPTDEPVGLSHFGIWVDDIDEAASKAEAAGATYYLGKKSDDPNIFYEVKFRDPDGIVFDITHSGWRGAVKEVLPATEPETTKADNH
jgi:lactoylglutathione lyase